MNNFEEPENELKPVVFIVDDDEAIRSGIADLVEAMGLCVRAFGSAEEFLNEYDPSLAGCLILDLQMPGMTGLELQKLLAESCISLPVIIITGHGYVAASVQSMKLGAVDFIEKPFRQAVLRDAITRALDQDRRSREKQKQLSTYAQRRAALTDREREVMDMIISGLTDKQIAVKLDVSHRAIAFHRAHILAKMHVTSAVELATLALTAGAKSV